MSYHPCECCGGLSFEKLFSKEDYVYIQCAACRLIRIDPQPTDTVLMSIYGSHYYKAWGVDTAAERVFELKKRTFQKHVFNRVNLPAGARILDCGAAFGALMTAAGERGWVPYGVELAKDAAGQIAKRFGADRIYSGPFEDAAFQGLKPGDFDAVFMCDFIEHVRDPESVLKKAAAFLKPGGKLVLTTPDGGSLSCRVMKAAWPHFKTEHLYYFNRKNMPLLLRRLGLGVASVETAYKVLEIEYIRNQFNTYPRRVVTPLVNLVARLIGLKLRTTPKSFSFGEMIVVAVKE